MVGECALQCWAVSLGMSVVLDPLAEGSRNGEGYWGLTEMKA